MTNPIDWSPNRKQFEDIQARCPAPLEQSWDYGDAIDALSFNTIRRGIVEIDGQPAASLQTAERSLPLGLRMVRLTRGPVIPDTGQLPEVVRSVRAAYPRWSRNLLFWMPDTRTPAPLLRPLGKRPMTTGYTTAWLDMTPEPDVLRANLRGNWRNALTQAEANPPVIRVTRRPEDVEEFIKGYIADKRAQKYSGPSASLVRKLCETFGQDVYLVRALDHGDILAASLFLRHGASATYYLSWTTAPGRERNAAHLALWQGIQRLRRTGVKWLDLGGMDARAPGLARFKLGLGAEAVTYSGTWF